MFGEMNIFLISSKCCATSCTLEDVQYNYNELTKITNFPKESMLRMGTLVFN